MSIARIVEISSTSNKSFEDAVSQGIGRASKTLRGIKSAWVKEQEAEVEGDKIVAYKVILKITFVLEDIVWAVAPGVISNGVKFVRRYSYTFIDASSILLGTFLITLGG
jgi:dodecin